MKNLQTTQENQIPVISDKINSSLNGLINMTKSLIPNWESKSVEKAKIALYPTFFNKSIQSQVIDNLDSLRESIKRMAVMSEQKMLQSERGQTLLAKAEQYDIPYDKDDIDWLDLIDVVRDYEKLLQRVEEYNIDWDISYYDPVGLEQTIEEHLHKSRKEKEELHWSCLSQRL